MTSSSDLLSVTKEIIRESAFVGLDVAGNSLLGPAWPPFKRIFLPVVKKLQRKYPKAFLLKGSSNPDNTEVKRAMDAFSADRQLQKQLLSGIEKLEEGRDEILHQVDLVQERLINIGSSIDRLEDLTKEKFEEVLQQLRDARADDLQPVEDMDVIEEQLSHLDPSLLEKLRNDPATTKVIREAIALGHFHFQVLEEGQIHKSYRIEAGGAVHFYTPFLRYTDKDERTCCDYEHIILRDGKREIMRLRACRQGSGKWEDIAAL